MFLDGALIPAHLLVNGRSIVQHARMARIDYFHIELDSHDVLLAEGAPAESFVDCDSRNMFQNAADYAALHPDDSRPGWAFCAPRIDDGPVLARVRLRLAALAGLDGEHADDAPTDGALVGHVDTQDCQAVSGWAFDATRPHSAVRLEILVDGRLAGTTVANTLRLDLKRAGIGDGRCAFAFRFRRTLSDGTHNIVVRRVTDGDVVTDAKSPDWRNAAYI